MEVSGGAERWKKEQRIIGFFCPITRHCSPSPRFSWPDQKEIYRGSEEERRLPVYHIRINTDRQSRAEQREGGPFEEKGKKG